MLARNLSLASAMTLVGLGLFANAGVNLAISGQGQAIAEERKGQAIAAASLTEMEPSMLASMGDDLSLSGDGAAETMAMGYGECVADGEPLSVWGAVREIAVSEICLVGITYSNVLALQRSPQVDLDGDGRVEALVTEFGTVAVLPSYPYCLVGIQQSSFVDDGIAVVQRRMISTEIFTQVALAQTHVPNPTAAEVTILGWFDCDGDDDLDCLAHMTIGNNNTAIQRLYWVENIGFEATQPLAGDLNDDGFVNAEDLAVVLFNWSGY